MRFLRSALAAAAALLAAVFGSEGVDAAAYSVGRPDSQRTFVAGIAVALLVVSAALLVAAVRAVSPRGFPELRASILHAIAATGSLLLCLLLLLFSTDRFYERNTPAAVTIGGTVCFVVAVVAASLVRRSVAAAYVAGVSCLLLAWAVARDVLMW